VIQGVRARHCAALNEAFNHWIVHGRPFVTVKAAMSLDGKIATRFGQSKWITGTQSRAFAMKLRRGADAILVGVNTVLQDNPRLTVRRHGIDTGRPLRRIILDAQARTPPNAQVISDRFSGLTTCVVSAEAPAERIARLASMARLLVAPLRTGQLDLDWILEQLGREQVVNLLVEGGGKVNASFLLGGYAHRIAFFYAPLILGGQDAPASVGGIGVQTLERGIRVQELAWRRVGPDLLLTGRIDRPQGTER
jgi:diaminohydroxyphosphoribosylaminopyrimidine deaminase / 5-amino-6-(5-phosphoribosylamino)uracil reductase